MKDYLTFCFYRMDLNLSQSKHALATLIKTIYTNLHQWLVEQINKIIGPTFDASYPHNYVGILDMPGFGNYI